MLNKQPESWNDISVLQFKEIHEINIDDYDLIDDYQTQLLSIITDTDLEYFEDLEYSKFSSLVNKFDFIKFTPNKPAKFKVNTPAGELFLNEDFNTLEIGEFIDLENLIIGGIEKNLSVILTIFYRQKIVNEKPLLFLDSFEPYGNWIFHRANLFNDVSINHVYGVIPKFLKFREELFETYSGLFDAPVEEEDYEEPNLNESVIEKSNRINEEKKNNIIKKWSWDIFLLKLALNDPTKIDEATRIPLIQALNVLSMKKELQILD